MAITAKITNDCKRIIVKIKNAPVNLPNKVRITNGSAAWEEGFPGSNTTNPVWTKVVKTADIGAENGIFHIVHLVDNEVAGHVAVLGICDILCCLAKKIDDLLDCNCDCSKCASQLAEAQKIFLLIKAGQAELAAYAKGGQLLDTEAAISNATKKYDKAVEMCGGHCGCNC